MATNKLLQIPYGTKDVLPGEARAKREMEDKIAANFLAWGYDEVETPTFEYLDTFALGGSGVSDESMKFMDRNNRTLVLRSDMTTPLARMVATRLQIDRQVQRLFYIANIFRYEETQAGRQCEFSQAGVELMGSAEPTADAEVLALAVKSMQAAGLNDFTLSLGHINFLAGIMEEANLTAAQAEVVKKLVLEHNVVGLEELVATLNLPDHLKQVYDRLLFLHGGPQLLAQLQSVVKNAKSRQALANMQAIYTLAEAYGVAPFISFDLSLIRNFEYYTGMVFEAYTAKLGFNICGGGRYDSMMASFGKNCPATGFAMGIDRIILALERQQSFNVASVWDVYVAYKASKGVEAIQKAMAFRAQGKTVKVATYAMTAEEASKMAKMNNCQSLAYVD